jgi:hypothetical protein
MKILMVAETNEALSQLCEQMESTAINALPFEVSFSAILSVQLLDEIEAADVVLLGADLSSKAAQLARRVKDALPAARIFVYLPKKLFKTNKFKPLMEGDVYKVFPENASEKELKKELLSIQSDVLIDDDRTHDSGLIAGRYEIVECLGKGSMGSVYACRHKELSGHIVAVKVLFPEVAQDEVAAARFRNEIFASYSVAHPNVVRAYEYLRQGAVVAFSMEYVDGGDLADLLAGSEGIALTKARDVLIQICSGVQAIHDVGIIHRDLKPENILFTSGGMVKIADFGIARTGDGPKLTEHGGVIGTIDYVSPEYMLTSEVDSRSDLYAIGVLAYEMITGRSPFQSDSVYGAMKLRLEKDPPSPMTLRDNLPEPVENIVMKALKRDPAERYQTAAEMKAELENLKFD